MQCEMSMNPSIVVPYFNEENTETVNTIRRLNCNPVPSAHAGLGVTLWEFLRLDTLRRQLIKRAGRLIRPQGQLTLSMSVNETLREELLHYLEALNTA